MSSSTVIREVCPNVWTFSIPFTRLGFMKVGGRSTAIKMADGGVLLFSPTAADTETETKIKEICGSQDGPGIKYIVAPDNVHHLHIDAWTKRYPKAKVIGVEGLVQKRKDVKFDGVYKEDGAAKTNFGYEDEFDACYFKGFQNRDVALYHKASKTLLEADLLFNLPPTEQYSKSNESIFPLGLMKQLTPNTGFHRFFLKQTGKDKASMSSNAKIVASWNIERIIPCHGDVIETGAMQAWKDAYRNFLS